MDQEADGTQTTPVLLYLLSGKDLRTEGRSSWSLRRKSKIIGAIGVTYGIAVIAISTAPGSYPVTIGMSPSTRVISAIGERSLKLI